MKKIFVVEDDVFMANMYRVKLKEAGFGEVKIFVDGEGVMGALQTEIPDLIVLDLIMPKKDGFSVLKDIRANTLTNKIPVLVVSKLSSAEDKKKVSDLGATEFLIKGDSQFSDLVDWVKNFASLNN